MLMLLFHGLESGIYSFTGEMFCPNYNFNYVTGSFGAGLIKTGLRITLIKRNRIMTSFIRNNF